MPADVSELLALADEFDAAGPRAARATVEAVSRAADAGVVVAKSTAPRRTGELASSIDKTVSGAGGAAGASAQIRATAYYAWFVYAGTSRQAPQPDFIDNARDRAEEVLLESMETVVEKALP